MIYLTHLPAELPRGEKAAAERSASRALLRFAIWQNTPALAEYPLEDLLTFGPHGKPYIRGNPFWFNLSHSGGIVVCAAAPCEVGVDVEQKRVFSERLAARICTPEEAVLIAAAPDRDAALTQLWTAKESAMKYTGLGMAQGILATAFTTLGEHPRPVSGTGHFTSLDLGPAYLTVCSAGQAGAELCEVPSEELFSQ